MRNKIVSPLSISIIIPTINEAEHIGKLIHLLQSLQPKSLLKEITVVDAGSTDETVRIAEDLGVNVIKSKIKSRAVQMNEGAKAAQGDLLYFIHADTTPLTTLLEDIDRAVQNNYGAGCYRLTFDKQHWFLKFNSWFTRFDIDGVRYGDQSLFVQKTLFEKVGGFRNDYLLFEDNEIIKRVKGKAKFIIMEKSVITSARKYRKHGVFKLQFVYYFIYLLYSLGFSQKKLVGVYLYFLKGC